METVLRILAVLTAGVAVCVVASAVQRLRGTTLLTAWAWALAFSVMGLLLGILDFVFAIIPEGWSELFWFLTAIVGLCPAVAVLGARRPVERVWNLFVIVPLLAVLGWPALTVLMEGAEPRALRLEAPSVVAFTLVLVMSYGNYIGTRYCWCVALAAAGQLLLLAPLFSEALTSPTADRLRPLGLICLSSAAILALAISWRPQLAADRFNRIWRDFRSSFGIVWSRRIMDRFNHQSQQQTWPYRLDRNGLVRESHTPARPDDLAQAEQFLRWLLRRFVDEDWIDARMLQSPIRARRDGSS